MGEFGIGATFADHVIRGVAGRGGMGVVYRALHVPLKREVALKVIAPEVSADEEFRARFRRELEAAASIQHPNVIPIHHAGEEDGLLYVTMRYVDGVDLARLVAGETRLEPVRAAVLIGQIGAALDAAHKRGFVHRDVKPANVLVEGEDGVEHALLTDFGLTKTMQSSTRVTQTGMLVGTFDYTAPEQLDERPVDERTDVYALGCVLFQTLTGRVPYPRESLPAKLFAHFEAPPPAVTELVPDAPAALDDVVRCALAKDSADRYASAGDLARAALAAVGRRSLASGVSRLAEGESAPGWRWSTPAPRPIDRVPLQPALGSEANRGVFAGREGALSRLLECYALAEVGGRPVVLISGQPGMGKTRLAAELARQVHARGATVLYGRSDPESLVPYQPFVSAVQHYLAQRDTLALPAELELELNELARLVPALRRHVPELRDPIAEDADTRRYRLFEAVTRLLATAARETPTVLMLDDLQWADTSTVLLLGHLLRDVETTHMLVVGTLREGGGEQMPPAMQAPAREAAFERIALDGLDAAETGALVAAHDERCVGDAFVRRLQEWTEGNPFYIKETLRTLTEKLPTDADAAAFEQALSGIAVPEGVTALIGDRLARLSETVNQLLTVASVVGREFRLELLEELSDEPVERIIAALEEAAAAGLVDEVEDDADCFVFTQALVRETLYERQSASRRVRLHHRIAEALERLAPRLAAPAAELAHHFVESRHLDRDGKAIGYCVQAAEEATASLAYQEAVAYYRRALRALEARGERDEPRRCALLLALAGAEARAGDPAARATFTRAAEIASSEGLADQLAEAALGRVAAMNQAGTIDLEGVALLERALTARGDRENALTAHLLARMANVLHFAGELERVDDLSSRSLELARRLGDPPALVAALEGRHAALLHGHLDERLRLSQELLSLARQIGEGELECIALHSRTLDLLESGDADGAREQSSALARLAEDLGQPMYRYVSMRWDVMWAQTDDRLDDAARLIEEAEVMGSRTQHPDVHLLATAQRVMLAYRHRALGGFAPAIEAQIAENPQLLALRPLLALAHLQAGDREVGVEEFERLAADDFAAFPRDALWFCSICQLAEASALLADDRRAAILYELILPHRGRNVMVAMATCWGSAERYLGLLAASRREWETAAGHFEAALAANKRAGIVSMTRMVSEEYADMLLARGANGDSERAHALTAAAGAN